MLLGGGISTFRSPSEPPNSSSDTGLLDYVWVLSRHRRLVFGIPAVAALLTFGISFLLPKRWTAEARFVPEASSSFELPQGIGALAGELGFSLPGADPMSSPDFYASVMEGRSLLERTLLTPFPVPSVPGATDSAPLIDILDIQEDNPRQRMESGVEWMRDHSSATVDAKTGTIEFSVELPDPDLAAAVASHMVGLLNDFNQRTRNLRARERRKFAEARTLEAQKDFEIAEDSLRDFLTRNRQFEFTPQLLFERNRLERQVTLRQEVYQTLRREFEIARIEEVNDTPVLTVVDPAVAPAKPSSPRRVRMALVAAVLGGLLGLTLAFLYQYLERSREQHPMVYQRVAQAWRRSRRRRGTEPEWETVER
ncbi:MAG TPA: GNVR domain-containing protein [Gemmatimonadales bacterium]|nr:GNVR domain-containing protein [Gemmatimonadales bacterium]